jgi:crossover junction endodeoxyribonuclease RuvC
MSQQPGVKTLTVLGVDPGLTRCGIGVVTGSPGAVLSLVDVGVIQTSPSLPLEQRLLELEASLISWFDKHNPDVIAIERVFSQHNVRTVMGTGQAAGIALLLAAKRGVPVVMHTPSEVKAAVTGNGRANKSQVADMVVRILSLKEAPKPVDSTDALALAICNIWRGSANSKIEDALAAEKMRVSKLVKR